MKKMFYTLIWVSVLCITSVYPVYSADVNSLTSKKINLSCRNMPLKEVVDSVYKQTGFTIHVEEDLLAMPITGKFNGMEVDSFFRRIFRGENVALLYSEKDKSCVVQTFGQKERKYYTAGKSEKVNQLTDMRLNELEALQNEQRRAFQEFSQDALSVDPLTGMKLGDIRESQEWQRKVFLEYSENPDSVDPIVGKTLGGLKESQDQQRQAFQAYSENSESIDKLTGLSLGEMERSRDQQRQEFQRYSSNQESIDPLTGLTLGQIRASQEKQRREFIGK